LFFGICLLSYFISEDLSSGHLSGEDLSSGHLSGEDLSSGHFSYNPYLYVYWLQFFINLLIGYYHGNFPQIKFLPILPYPIVGKLLANSYILSVGKTLA